MTSKAFNKEFVQICKNYSYEFAPQYENQIRFIGNTPFGKIQVIADPSPKIKLYTVYFRFLEDFDINFFYRYFSKNENINKFSKKWNLQNTLSDYVLNEVDERLNNLNYILKRDGKICGTAYKPFLNEIEEKKEAPKGFETFIQLAKKHTDPKIFTKEVRKIKNVPIEIATYFFNTYNPTGNKTIEQTAKIFIADVATS